MSNRFKPGIFTRAAVAGVLAVGLVPSAAFAATSSDEGSSNDSLISAMADEQVKLYGSVSVTGNTNLLYSAASYSDGVDASLTSTTMPTSFDLRDRGTVTPVKDQTPWGTCWSFGSTAAAETSILNKLGFTYDEYNLDLSELQTAWFSRSLLPEGSGSQAGEGGAAVEGADPLNTGGTAFLASSMYASGVGPVDEAVAPYRNKEGITLSYRDLFGDDLAEIKKASDPAFDVDAPMSYSPKGDWSVDEALRFQKAYQLNNANLLPSPANVSTDVFGATATGYSYNEDGTAAIKQQLMAGNAVQVSFASDNYMPGKASSTPQYINTDTWAHYTWKPSTSNHAVTIVGWDDDYSKENFLEGHQPASNGAWIVKNSWGSSSEEFPNNGGGWGYDGYFYLSYYDQSLSDVEVLDFDVYQEVSNTALVADSYSYMPVSTLSAASVDDKVSMANIFTAQQDQVITSLSTETGSACVTATFDVYLLDDDATSPTDGKHVASKSETFEYSGFHRVDLKSGVIMKEGQRYSVVVTQRSVDGKYQTVQPSGMNEAFTERLGVKSYCVGVVNKGESFLGSGSSWQDWTDGIVELRAKLKKACEALGIDDLSEQMDFDNLPIRAYGTVYATPAFSDVAEDVWYAPAVAKVADAGLMTGFEGSDEFGVGHALTRAELVTILWRNANPVDAEAYDYTAVNTTDMDDVADNAFYTGAADWAVANGVIDGVETEGGREFQPDRAVTFEEAVAMIAKYAKAADGDAATLGKFADADAVSDWARGTMAWAVEAGLVNGEPTDEGLMLKPASDIMRERAAGVLSNAIDLKIIG